MADFSFPEMLVIIVVAILIYGKDLPQAARKLAGLYSRFRRHLSDIKYEIQRQIPADEIREAMKVDVASPWPDPPPVPTGVAATTSGNQILLAWDSSAGATSYTVKRCAAREDPFAILNDHVTALSYTDAELKEGATYSYVVSASNPAGESGNSEEAEVTLTATGAPETAAASQSSTEANPPAAPEIAPTASAAASAEAASGNGTPPSAASLSGTRSLEAPAISPPQGLSTPSEP